MHVLVISNHWDVPGSAPFIDRQIAALKLAGLTVSTFNLGTGHSPLHLLRKWWSLRQTVNNLNPGLIYTRYGTIVAATAAFSGLPAVVTFAGSDLLPGASVSRIRMRVGIFLSNVAATRAAAIICVSEELRQALWRRRDRMRAVVIPGGVDLDIFCPGPQAEARIQLGWNHDNRVVLFNAKRDPINKGLDLAEAAMHYVYSRVPNAKLHVVSNVDPTSMPVYYRAADVLLCTSKQEGSPNVIKEALACNLPVVSVSVGDVPERLKGVSPSTVTPRDPQAIGEAVAGMLEKGKRSNGRQSVIHLDIKKVTYQIANVFRSALALESMREPSGSEKLHQLSQNDS
jgi:teichuronic acid biosynthesis glycosyltransferase TuaC